jgi:hypothetical protein
MSRDGARASHPDDGARLSSFRNRQLGETVVVCGCGESLRTLADPSACVTIGTNDVGRLFTPDYLVVVNPPTQFTGDRWSYVEGSRAKFVFSQLDLRLQHAPLVKFRLGRFGEAGFDEPDLLHYTQNSPYVAVSLALFMGAARIGLIGVDFTDGHFFAATGAHPLNGRLDQIDREYARLRDHATALGTELVNLSPTSRLRSLPRMPLDSFVRAAAPRRGASHQEPRAAAEPLRVVSYSVTPVAGVPEILARCIASDTHHRAHCVWAERSYGNGVAFDGGIDWKTTPSEAESTIRDADVIIVHNGKVDPRHERLLDGKAVVTMAHNYAWNVDQRFVREGFPGVVVGQYQAGLPEFSGWRIVPNPVPINDAAFQPGRKPREVAICYTPSGTHERYPAGHRLYWHAKGYDTTMRVLEKMAERFGVRLEVVGDRPVVHAESLAMKRRSHIVIDECVTGSYHRNSLEGLAAGCVVVNGVGLLPSVVDALGTCAPSAARLPFVFSRLDNLEHVLASLIARGSAALEEEGRSNRAWLEEHWDFGLQWRSFWLPAIESAIARRGGRAMRAPGIRVSADAAAPTRYAPARPQSKPGVSVVIPHGGPDRLPQLAAALVNLRQCSEVSEVIVAEMGASPVAEDLARRWADKYIFMRHHEEFERARALNVGTALAEHDLVLWRDNDLVMPGRFVARAAAELVERRLDSLIPYTTIHYLGEAESRLVMRGELNPGACTPTNVMHSGRGPAACSGGLALVRRDFIRQYGGLVEGFRGWGGEDNAWNHKAGLLGRLAPTSRRDQDVYHLYHPISGGHGRAAMRQNRHYASNVALLGQVWALKDGERFLSAFPPPVHLPCAWSRDRRVLVVSSERNESIAVALADAIRALFGASVDVARKEAPPDAVVSFGDPPGTSARDDELRSRTLVVIEPGWAQRGVAIDALRGVAAVAACNPEVLAALSEAGLRPWRCDGCADDPARAALALAQPLSLLLGRANDDGVGSVVTETPEPPPRSVTTHRQSRDDSALPVWVYWEGACPDWIARCRETMVAHAPTVRLLTPESFAALWDRDRDIDIARLQVAHRADFIRAFLLARYGGMWIDSDCLVMRPLRRVLEHVEANDFVGHRERSGYVSNGFIGARPGSRIADAFYRRICEILRSSRPLGWISLGGQPLTEIVNGSGTPWHEYAVEQVQPICWSEPEAFFARGDPAAHGRRFDRRALCYMLSNTTVVRHQSAHPGASLLAADSFFSYLLDRALSSSSDETADADVVSRPRTDRLEEIFAAMIARYRRFGDESLSGPGSCLAQTVELRERLPLLLEDLHVRSLLDAPCGDFNWMKEVRLGLDEYIGADILAEIVAENERRHGGPSRRFLKLDVTSDRLPRAQCILSRDCLTHFSLADAMAALRNFKSSGAQYLLTTTFPDRERNEETSGGAWRPINLQRPPFDFPAPLRIIDERCSEARGVYGDKSLALWSLDALHL